jgi:multidrug efflux pump subunit AcrA (membrane-fusion protein)
MLSLSVTVRRLVMITVAVWAFSSCGIRAKIEAPKPAVVFTKKIQPEQISDSLYYPARARAKVNATVLSESDGIISKVFVTLGKHVRSQQVLMVLSHTDPIYKYAPVQILAPIQGIVSSIDVTPGSHVTQGQKLAAVINPSQLEIQVEVPAQDLSVIKKGMIGEFKVLTQENLLKVEVSGVSPFVDPNSGTAVAQLEILSKTHPILSPGVQGQVIFKTNVHMGFLIPDSAVVYKGKDSFVKVIEDLKIKEVSAELGPKHGGSVEVIKGLYSGAQVVERSSRFVADGEVVEVQGSL